jgi:hypothetical protein
LLESGRTFRRAELLFGAGRCLLTTIVFGDDMSSPSNDPVPQPQPVVSAQQARQGATGQNVRYVLGFSIAAVVVVFGIIWLAYFA